MKITVLQYVFALSVTGLLFLCLGAWLGFIIGIKSFTKRFIEIATWDEIKKFHSILGRKVE